MTGSALQADGSPLSGALVQIAGTGIAGGACTTDGQGLFDCSAKGALPNVDVPPRVGTASVGSNDSGWVSKDFQEPAVGANAAVGVLQLWNPHFSVATVDGGPAVSLTLPAGVSTGANTNWNLLSGSQEACGGSFSALPLSWSADVLDGIPNTNVTVDVSGNGTSFTSPPFALAHPTVVPISHGAACTVGGTAVPACPLTDGTFHAQAFQGSPTDVTLTLGSATSLRKAVLYSLWESSSGTGDVDAVQGSTDGVNWVTLGQYAFSVGMPSGTVAEEILLDGGFSVTQVRVRHLSNGTPVPLAAMTQFALYGP